jgi:hypothetical protein
LTQKRKRRSKERKRGSNPGLAGMEWNGLGDFGMGRTGED